MKTGRYVGIEGSPAIYRYRNKMEYTFGNLEKGGGDDSGDAQTGVSI